MKTSKAAAGILLSIVILVLAQNLTLNLCELFLDLGTPAPVCNILAGSLYLFFAFAGIKLLCEKFLKQSMPDMRILPVNLKIRWLLAAVLMPICVLLLAVLAGGHWQKNAFDTETTLSVITGAAAFYGLAAGIVEEMVFRGVIMGCLEKKCSVKAAIFIPSVLFGMVHLIGQDLDLISMIQVLTAGSLVGILFSLITYESHSIWNSAAVHSIWNMMIIGGVLHIGSTPDSQSLYNFILESRSFLLSGGDFGIEASVLSILAYLVVLVWAFLSLKKQRAA